MVQQAGLASRSSACRRRQPLACSRNADIPKDRDESRPCKNSKQPVFQQLYCSYLQIKKQNQKICRILLCIRRILRPFLAEKNFYAASVRSGSQGCTKARAPLPP